MQILIGIFVYQSGKWTYDLTNVDSSKVVISMMITSEVTNSTDSPIRVNSWMSSTRLNYPNVAKVKFSLHDFSNFSVDCCHKLTIFV